MEKIISITEVNKNLKDELGFEEEYEGYLIKTNTQEMFFGISNEQQCCEDWGYITTEDNLNDFIDAEINDIRVTKDDLITESLKDKLLKKNKLSFYEDDFFSMFITIQTSKGDLQFVLYNQHNGCYSHNVKIQSIQINKEDQL